MTDDPRASAKIVYQTAPVPVIVKVVADGAAHRGSEMRWQPAR
jgi:hypothetical protein